MENENDAYMYGIGGVGILARNRRNARFFWRHSIFYRHHKEFWLGIGWDLSSEGHVSTRAMVIHVTTGNQNEISSLPSFRQLISAPMLVG